MNCGRVSLDIMIRLLLWYQVSKVQIIETTSFYTVVRAQCITMTFVYESNCEDKGCLLLFLLKRILGGLEIMINELKCFEDWLEGNSSTVISMVIGVINRKDDMLLQEAYTSKGRVCQSS